MAARGWGYALAVWRAFATRLAKLAATVRAGPSVLLPVPIGTASVLLLTLVVALALDAPVATLARHLPPSAIHVFADVTLLGQGWVSIAPAVLVALWLARASFAARTRRERARLRLAAERAMFVASAIILPSLVGTVLKHIVGRVRPPHVGPPHPFDFEPLSAAASRASFPSGHSVTVAALFVAVVAVAPRWRLPLAVLAIAVFASRIAIEAH